MDIVKPDFKAPLAQSVQNSAIYTCNLCCHRLYGVTVDITAVNFETFENLPVFSGQKQP